ncbi:MAG: DUF1080 domain-containing protein [Planctomycetes bacterium]|nr:DUF1080 domain-containing protein [Planctomycetota bacterium]
MNQRSWLGFAVVAILFVSMSLAAEAVEPFNGKNLDGWKYCADPEKSQWTVGTAAVDPANPRNLKVTPGGNEMVNAGAHGVDIYSEATFGDATIELEVMVPQGSNSGIYVMGVYEIQVLDSFGRTKLGMGDMGAIYSMSVPRVNASLEPGKWQKYVIEYRAPKFDAGGKKTANGQVVKVTLNGTLIHENVELANCTPGGVSGKEAAEGPIMFQGNHGQVAYRNIRITPRAAGR